MDINEVKEKHEAELLKKPNVVGVGVGEKGGVPAVIVFVRMKVPVSSLSAGGRIPDALDGHPVKVMEIGSPST